MLKSVLLAAGVAGALASASSVQAGTLIPIVPVAGSTSTYVSGINDNNLLTGGTERRISMTTALSERWMGRTPRSIMGTASPIPEPSTTTATLRWWTWSAVCRTRTKQRHCPLCGGAAATVRGIDVQASEKLLM
jgi:hypothetical protein